jgi:hypothetical protein
VEQIHLFKVDVIIQCLTSSLILKLLIFNGIFSVQHIIEEKSDVHFWHLHTPAILVYPTALLIVFYSPNKHLSILLYHVHKYSYLHKWTKVMEDCYKRFVSSLINGHCQELHPLPCKQNASGLLRLRFNWCGIDHKSCDGLSLCSCFHVIFDIYTVYITL